MTVPSFDSSNEAPLAADQPPSRQPSQGALAPDAAGASASGGASPTPGGGRVLAAVRAVVRVVGSRDYVGVLIAIVALVLIIGVARPAFLRFGQLTDVLNQATFVAILACGMAMLLAMRELDLSVGSIYALTCGRRRHFDP